MTLHGGTVTGKAVRTEIGGQPAAREGDPHVCPVHGKGLITGGSGSVFIEGKAAARLTDACKCALTGVSGAGAPPAIGPGSAPFIYPGGPFTAPPKVSSTDSRNRTSEQRLEEDGYHGPYAEAEVSDSDGDGTRDTARAEAGWSRRSERLESPEVGGYQITGTHQDDQVRGRAEVGASTGEADWGTYSCPTGVSARVGAEANVARQRTEVQVDTPFGDGGVAGEASVLSGEADGEVFAGYDGTRIGWEVGGGLQGDLAGVKLEGMGEKEIGDTGVTVQGKADVGFSLGVGGELGIGVYGDRTDGRIHFKGRLGLKELGGFSFHYDVSIGPFTKLTGSPGGGGGASGSGSGAAPGPVPPGGIPNKIATGFPLVLIGD